MILRKKVIHTVKEENCAVVLLYVLMDDTLTTDIMWFLFVQFFYFRRKCDHACTQINEGVPDFYCAINHCPHDWHE